MTFVQLGLAVVVLCWFPSVAPAVQKTCVLQWNPVPEATGYRVLYRDLNIDVQNVTQVALFAVGIEQPGQTESVTIQAYNAQSTSLPSAAVSVTIDALPPPPPPSLAQVTGVQVSCP
ncbi:rim binding protein 2 domain [Caudoviricetes sp.]|nr:rim binding protein 2 domain [Caudoviricetes sp.]UOF81336.1 rim binding protein 2 domain [Caudoviricetes sp.]